MVNLPAAGKVNFAFRSSSDFNKYTDNPPDTTKSWLQSHFWRFQSSSPYCDSKISWLPPTWIYINLYAVYPDSDILKNHPDWILHDHNGNKLFIPWGCSGGTCPQYAGDVSNQSFRNQWITDTKNKLSKGYKGVWIDDVNLDMRVSNGNGVTVIPYDNNTSAQMTPENWRRYMVEMLEQIRTALPGYEILHNSIWFSSPTEYHDPYVIRQIKAANYIIAERGFSDPNLIAGTGPFSMGDFLNFVNTVHSNGSHMVLDEYKQNGEFGLAGYYLISDGSDALGNQETNPNNWWSGYDTDLGAPLGVAISWFGLYRRDFTNGIVLLNPLGSASSTVTLPGNFKTLTGSSVTKVTLMQGQASVLLGTIVNPINTPILINSGGPTVGTFMADGFVTGGHVDKVTKISDISKVSDAAPQEVYQTKRTSDNANGFSYTFPNLVSQKKHTIRLHFSEDVSWKPYSRQFNVVVNGVKVLTAFDVVAVAGQFHACVQTLTVLSDSAGVIKVDFIPTIGNSLLNGIEIIPL